MKLFDVEHSISISVLFLALEVFYEYEYYSEDCHH